MWQLNENVGVGIERESDATARLLATGSELLLTGLGGGVVNYSILESPRTDRHPRGRQERVGVRRRMKGEKKKSSAETKANFLALMMIFAWRTAEPSAGGVTQWRKKKRTFWLRYAADRWMTTSGHRRKRPLGKK